jgi:FkbM family methyltransferase
VDKSNLSYYDGYVNYLQQLGFALREEVQYAITSIVDATDWDNPCTGQDWNNVGVASLIKAQDCDDFSMKVSWVNLAQNAFRNGEAESVLCKAHSALLKVLTGQFQEARQQSFAALLQLQFELETNVSFIPLGLIYFPVGWYERTIDQSQVMELLYSSPIHGIEQAYQYLNQIFVRSAQIFYNPMGLQTLSVAAQVTSNSPLFQLKQGIAARMTQQIEGFIYLHSARRLAPKNSTVLQSLSLAYRDIGQESIAHHYWLEAQQCLEGNADFSGLWTQVESNATFTYVLFDQGVTLTVQPSLNSVVTGVLLGEGDWFESEMEFWRSRLQPGMTVIDVGANAGVYTFSAATRIGPSGKVIAIEPFPACVSYLEETCRVNQFGWVRVYGAAASDHNGSIRLSIKGASEFNEVIDDNEATLLSGQYVEVPCLTLDSLIEQEQMEAVHFMKLDAEGYEINVLQGCQQILETFSPVILYENSVGGQENNLEVAEFLIQHGYQLHFYQPYFNQLIPLKSLDELNGQLNIVATPQSEH